MATDINRAKQGDVPGHRSAIEGGQLGVEVGDGLLEQRAVTTVARCLEVLHGSGTRQAESRAALGTRPLVGRQLRPEFLGRRGFSRSLLIVYGLALPPPRHVSPRQGARSAKRSLALAPATASFRLNTQKYSCVNLFTFVW